MNYQTIKYLCDNQNKWATEYSIIQLRIKKIKNIKITQLRHEIAYKNKIKNDLKNLIAYSANELN
jgi:hypothetical protein